MKTKDTCDKCIKGTVISVNNDILCPIKGVVSSDYSCPKFKLKPTTTLFKEIHVKCIDCENFTIGASNSIDPQTIGLCRLFSVRKFDGASKNACSRFENRRQLEIS